MRDPIPMLSIVIFYNYFIQKIGPALMANREPFNLNMTLIIYNFLQVLISVYLFLEGARLAWFKDYNWLCQPVDHGTSPVAMSIATACYTYFLAKLSELLDTVFFVLRKKEKQITFLHLYHHTVMPIVAWGCVKYYPGGHGTFIGFINSFVHIIMYSYYMLAALGPSVHKYLWWKKYVTTLQLLQFCIAFLHSSLLFFYDCGYPRFSLWFTVPNTIFFYFLFSDFYEKAYGASRPLGPKTSVSASSAGQAAGGRATVENEPMPKENHNAEKNCAEIFQSCDSSSHGNVKEEAKPNSPVNSQESNEFTRGAHDAGDRGSTVSTGNEEKSLDKCDGDGFSRQMNSVTADNVYNGGFNKSRNSMGNFQGQDCEVYIRGSQAIKTDRITNGELDCIPALEVLSKKVS